MSFEDPRFSSQAKAVMGMQAANKDALQRKLEAERRAHQRTKQELAIERLRTAKLGLIVQSLTKQVRGLCVDGLTGIFNRAGLNKLIESNLDGVSGQLIFVDLDQFKPINDTYGHDAGDEALRIVGEMLTKNVRSEYDIIALTGARHKDTSPIAARYGGDEFVIIMPGLEGEHAKWRMDELQEKFDALSFKWNGQTIKFGATLGMASFGGDVSVDQAKSNADAEMYERKEQRREKYGWAPR